MAFDILQARSLDDEPDPLYPVPAEGINSFALESDDGNVLAFDCSGAIVASRQNHERTELGRVEKVKATIAVTDSRFVFACTRFQTGGGFMGGGVGGVLIAGAANAISGAMAARSTRGYSLVGHVRYEWLADAAITATDRSWGQTQNSLRIAFKDPTPGGVVSVLTVFPPNRQPSAQVGAEVTRRAALALMRGRTAIQRAAFEEFAARMPSSPTPDGHGRFWRLPD